MLRPNARHVPGLAPHGGIEVGPRRGAGPGDQVTFKAWPLAQTEGRALMVFEEPIPRPIRRHLRHHRATNGSRP
jgi:hypothetical protein